MRTTTFWPIMLTLLLISNADAISSPSAPTDNPDQIQRTFSLGMAPLISVENIKGPVKIQGRKDASVELRVLKEGGTAEERAELGIEILPAQDKLSVRTYCLKQCEGHRGGDCCSWSKVKVSYQLFLPLQAQCRSKNVSGSIVAKEIQGSLDLSTVSGDVRTEATGTAPLKLHTVSGSIQSIGFNADAHAKSVSGTIDLKRSNGNDHELVVSTVSGAIRLMIHPKSNAEVKISTMSGQIKVDLPLQNIRQRRNSSKGTLGKGGPLLKATTVSGSISLLPLKS